MIQFLDVGAHQGTTITNFLSKNPEYDGCRVFCIEPSPRHWERLLAVRDQFVSRYDIILCPFGLSNTTHTTSFFEKIEPSGDSFCAYHEAAGPVVNSPLRRNIIGVTIGVWDFLSQHIDPTQEVEVKLDCEGSEYFIIPALVEHASYVKKLRQVLVEYHGIPGIDPNHYTRMMQDQGWQVCPWTL